MLRTRITEMLGVEHPIIQAGMAGAADVDLVVAVSEAGGVGVLGASSWSPEQVAERVARIRARTSRPFGVNRLLYNPDPLQREERRRALRLALEGGARLLSTAWGGADEVEEIAGEAASAGVPLMHMVTTADQAADAARAGASIVVVQGQDGGGHIGTVGTMAGVPAAIDAIAHALPEGRRPPVVAAGGIADGRGLAAALALGAEGVLIGTRFLATPEANEPAAAKAAMCAATEADTVSSRVRDIVYSPAWVAAGAFARSIRTPALEVWLDREAELASMDRAALAEMGATWRRAVQEGRVDEGEVLAGQSCGLIHEILPAGEIVRRIAAEAEAILRRLPHVVAESVTRR